MGSGVDAFFDSKKIDNSWHLLLYEPNRDCLDTLKNKYPSAEIVNKAVTDKDGYVTFYPDNQHGNIINEKNESGYLVQTEDINKIMDRFTDYEKIILRIDVEGSEYLIVPIMLEHPNIKKINELYIEWHREHEKGNTEELARNFIKNIPFVMESYFGENSLQRILTTHKD
jgi:FkbM family methyltransferase